MNLNAKMFLRLFRFPLLALGVLTGTGPGIGGRGVHAAPPAPAPRYDGLEELMQHVPPHLRGELKKDMTAAPAPRVPRNDGEAKITQLERDLIRANPDVLPGMWNDNASGNAAVWFGKEHEVGGDPRIVDPLGLKQAYKPDAQNAQSQFRTYEALTAAGLVKFYETMEGRQRQAK